MNCQDFFREDYVDQASYDNLRKISSAVDGLKNSNRKVIHTVLDKNLKELLKAQQLAAKASEYTDYLHGSLDSVIVTLGQDFVGSNQVPLLTKKGNFGTRSIPEASASRYIFARGSNLLWDIFRKEDRDTLIHQSFEGEDIEPRFFVPVIPMLLVNGNRGVSSGFSQLILPRNIKSLVAALISRLQGKSNSFKELESLELGYPGFNGKVYRDPEVLDAYRWIIEGTVEIGKKEVCITELPLDARLIGYTQFLEDLKDAKKIKDFKDECQGDSFRFRVTFPGKDLEKHTEESLIKLFKLRTFVTENFTSLGSDNKIKEFKNPSEILDHYYETRLGFLKLRKARVLGELRDRQTLKSEQVRFLELVTSKKLTVQDYDTKELDAKLKELKFLELPDYRYLTDMPISNMRVDTLDRLKKDLQNLHQEIEDLTAKSEADIWLQDLKDFIREAKSAGIL